MLLASHVAFAQTDTIASLPEIKVTAYRDAAPLLALPSSISIVTAEELRQQSGESLVPALNAVPGVRMDERSPGSYRLSIRGSLLRSPFGIRNVKIYLDEFPLTDAGGNTYLNLLDANAVQGIEIVKGPEASLYGANTGGVVLVRPVSNKDSSFVMLQGLGGSYGLFHENATLQRSWKKGTLNISQGWQRADGYRENSAMKRHYVHSFLQQRYSKRSTLKFMAFYSNLDYETPGGLTLTQYRADPSSARKATAVFPGAVEQRAGVQNETLFGGLSNETRINDRWRYALAIFGSTTDFQNPFITNYETRDERTAGMRTYVQRKSFPHNRVTTDLQLGIEGAITQSDILNYSNNYGTRDSLQSGDDVDAFQRFAFTQASFNIARRFTAEAALSTNLFTYRYKSKTADVDFTTKAFTPQLMSRVALSYKLTQNLAWRASASRGYSPPTVAEIRPSDNVVYTNLQPENGWNYETGLRGNSANGRWQADAVVFYFHLTQAIVRRLSETEAEYFVNAGGTQQLGFELDASVWLVLPRTAGALRSLRLSHALTAYDFTFSDYKDNDKDYSGNALTGVPKITAVSSLATRFADGIFFFIQHNHTGRVPLNDANTAYAGAYDIVQMKLSYDVNVTSKTFLRVQAGVDNLFDATYSLGNDLNAVGQRYYNPAPPRNYYGGVAVIF